MVSASSALMARDDSTLLTRALKRFSVLQYIGCVLPVLSTTALDYCPVDTSSSKMMRQHTQLILVLGNKHCAGHCILDRVLSLCCHYCSCRTSYGMYGIQVSEQTEGGYYCFQLDSSALLDAAVRSSLPTSAEREVKVSPVPVVKSKKTPSITAKLKSPAPVGRAKKLSLDKTVAEKGVIIILIPFIVICYYRHTHTHNRFTALWNLSGKTRVSRYQKNIHPLLSS